MTCKIGADKIITNIILRKIRLDILCELSAKMPSLILSLFFFFLNQNIICCSCDWHFNVNHEPISTAADNNFFFFSFFRERKSAFHVNCQFCRQFIWNVKLFSLKLKKKKDYFFGCLLQILLGALRFNRSRLKMAHLYEEDWSWAAHYHFLKVFIVVFFFFFH